MPQLRWTLLLLGILFVILLAYIERRRQRQRFTDHAPAAEREQALDPQSGSGPMFREPVLTLPEMRAREPASPQDLPIVEIEDDSLNARRVETGEPLLDPPTLSLPVLDSGPTKSRERSEPATLPNSVAVAPGQLTVAVTPVPRSSKASASVNEFTNALVA